MKVKKYLLSQVWGLPEHRNTWDPFLSQRYNLALQLIAIRMVADIINERGKKSQIRDWAFLFFLLSAST